MNKLYGRMIAISAAVLILCCFVLSFDFIPSIIQGVAAIVGMAAGTFFIFEYPEYRKKRDQEH